MRVDPAVRPTMYRCATVPAPSSTSCAASRTSCGWATCCGSSPIGWSWTTALRRRPLALYVDCSANGPKRPAMPVFGAGMITLQRVRACQQVFSAALTAHVEAAYPDDAVKNELCGPVPHPDTPLDFARMTSATTATICAGWTNQS